MSNDIDIEIEVNDKQIAQRIEKAIDAGIADAAGDVGDGMENRAETKIEREAVWRGELLESLTETHQKTGDTWHIVLRNTAPHAGPQEYGAEFDTLPNIENLIPWVRDNLWAYTINDGNLQPDPNLIRDGGIHEETTTFQVSYSDHEIVDVTPGPEWGLDDDTADADALYVIEYDNGTKDIFKEYDGGSSAPGTEVNEQLFTAAVSFEFDKAMGPESRHAEIDGMEGTVQAFVPDAYEADDDINWSWSPSEKDAFLYPDEFLDDNTEDLAPILVADYILGNTDRHMKNLLSEPDGTIHAIDNGGYGGPQSLDDRLLIGKTEFLKAGSYPGRDEEMVAAVENLIEEQKKYFEILKDEEVRERILKNAAMAHGMDSNWYERLDGVLFKSLQGEDSFLKSVPGYDHLYEKHQDDLLERVKGNADLDEATDADVEDAIDDLDAALDDATQEDLNDL